MTLHPQVVALMAGMDRPGQPRMHELPVEIARKMFSAMPEFLGHLDHTVPSEDRSLPGPHGEVPVRIYTPADASGRPIVVFYHGGGFCIGDLDSHHRECQAISDRSGSVVVSVDYRMGPEHAYTADDEQPAWIDDSWAALSWVAANADELGGDGRRLVVCGDSAGGNISAVMAQMARDNGIPVVLQALIYPALDTREEAFDLYPSHAENAEAPFLERPVLDYFKAQSRPDGDNHSPLMSPAMTEDLSDLASALILTAAYDPLRDDGEAYAGRLREAGVAVELKRYDGMPHGFFQLAPHVDAATEAVGDVVDAIDRL